MPDPVTGNDLPVGRRHIGIMHAADPFHGEGSCVRIGHEGHFCIGQIIRGDQGIPGAENIIRRDETDMI